MDGPEDADEPMTDPDPQPAPQPSVPRHAEASHAPHAPADEHAGPVHDAVDHGEDHGHDDHAHGAEALGPVDGWAWGAGALGIAVAAVTAVCFAWATGAI